MLSFLKLNSMMHDIMIPTHFGQYYALRVSYSSENNNIKLNVKKDPVTLNNARKIKSSFQSRYFMMHQIQYLPFSVNIMFLLLVIVKNVVISLNNGLVALINAHKWNYSTSNPSANVLSIISKHSGKYFLNSNDK